MSSTSSATEPITIHTVASHLTRQSFTSTIYYYAISLPSKKTAPTKNALKGHVLQKAKTKSIYDDAHDKARRVLVLNVEKGGDSEVIDQDHVESILPAVVLDLLNSNPELSLSCYPLIKTYADYSVDEVLKRIIPHEVTDDIPSSFESVGHIAHLNIRENMLPYKLIIAQVIIDKNTPRIRTVVNKTGQIQTEFRTFPMEVLHGNGDMEVELREDGCVFQLDFAKVYWNSRLQYEHRRVVDFISGMKHGGANSKSASASASTSTAKSGNDDERPSKVKKTEVNIVVADIMAGIGPFVIPLASTHKIKCHANDLNPISFHYLQSNTKKNKCEKLVTNYCMDGRAFIHKLTDEEVMYDHAVMNLPAIAVEFLDAYRGWVAPKLKPLHRPLIHVYCFIKGDNMIEIEGKAILRCEKALGCKLSLDEDEVDIHVVRDVAPNKPMLCVRFRLPEMVKGLERIDLEMARKDFNDQEHEGEEDEDEEDGEGGHVDKKLKSSSI